MLVEKENITSISKDLIPLLVKCQYQKKLVEREEINKCKYRRKKGLHGDTDIFI
jgi:hypothetical protein